MMSAGEDTTVMDRGDAWSGNQADTRPLRGDETFRGTTSQICILHLQSMIESYSCVCRIANG